LNCSNFPEGPDLCMRPQDSQLLQDPTFDPILKNQKNTKKIISSLFPSCPVDLVDLDPSNKNESCAFRCNKDTMFPKSAKVFIQQYAFLASSISMGVTAITVLCFLVDIHRFRFPERL